MQSEQKESTQQIADHKDQLSNNRGRTKESKRYEPASLGSGVSEEDSR